MFDSFLIKERSLENDVQDGQVIGFKFQVRIAEYRGCFLSLLHGYYVTVDGEEYGRELQSFEINGKAPRSFDEIKKCIWEHWDFADWGTLHVKKPGGLTRGKHHIGLKQGLLMQYGWSPRDQEIIDNTPDPINTQGKQSIVYYYDEELI